MPHLHETDPQIVADDLAWDKFITEAERLFGDDIDDLDSAYIAHRNGVTASDYALEVVARAGEMV